MYAKSVSLRAYPTVVYARSLSPLVYPMVVYTNSDTDLPYPTVVYTRSISLLTYPTAVYIHFWHTQLPCTQGSEPYVLKCCAPYCRSIALLAYSAVVYARSISLQAYPTVVYTSSYISLTTPKKSPELGPDPD